MLVALLLYCVALEVVTSVGFKKISQGARRVHEDYSKAIQLQPMMSGKETVLLVGNSLLVAGVDRVLLRDKLSLEYSVTFWPIENTAYLDWYFGMRRLFAQGSRPASVVLCLSPRQLTSDAVNGEGFAHQMMQSRDILMVKKAANLDPSTASAFLLAHYSSWLGNRSSIRNWILEKWLPNASLLTSTLAPRARGVSDARRAELLDTADQRLSSIRELSESHGAKFVLLVPPLNADYGLTKEVRNLGKKKGVSVLEPYESGEMPKSQFSDGFHLNQSGAEAFTERLASMLPGTLR